MREIFRFFFIRKSYKCSDSKAKVGRWIATNIKQQTGQNEPYPERKIVMKKVSLRIEEADAAVCYTHAKGFASATATMANIISRGRLGRGFEYKNPNDRNLEHFFDQKRLSPSMLALDSVGTTFRTAFQIRHAADLCILRFNSIHGEKEEDFLAASGDLFFDGKSGLLREYRIYKY